MSRSQSALNLCDEEISSLLKIFPEGLIALDLETTGLSPLVDKIIEIAAIKIDKQGNIFTFHQLINPLIEIPPFTVQFHGLQNEDLRFCPTIKKPLKALWDFMERLPVVAHNSSFDLGHLIKASHDFQIDFPPLDVYDSCRYARAVLKKEPLPPSNYKLSTLSHYVGFELKHHIALEDSFACLKIMAFLGRIGTSHHAAKEKSFVFRLSHFNKNECFTFPQRLKDLADMVQKKELIQFHYKGSSKIVENRPVRPIGLMPLPRGAVLFAECLLTGKNKSFVLKKIKSFKKLEASLLERE